MLLMKMEHTAPHVSGCLLMVLVFAGRGESDPGSEDYGSCSLMFRAWNFVMICVMTCVVTPAPLAFQTPLDCSRTICVGSPGAECALTTWKGHLAV